MSSTNVGGITSAPNFENLSIKEISNLAKSAATMAKDGKRLTAIQTGEIGKEKITFVGNEKLSGIGRSMKGRGKEEVEQLKQLDLTFKSLYERANKILTGTGLSQKDIQDLERLSPEQIEELKKALKDNLRIIDAQVSKIKPQGRIFKGYTFTESSKSRKDFSHISKSSPQVKKESEKTEKLLDEKNPLLLELDRFDEIIAPTEPLKMSNLVLEESDKQSKKLVDHLAQAYSSNLNRDERIKFTKEANTLLKEELSLLEKIEKVPKGTKKEKLLKDQRVRVRFLIMHQMAQTPKPSELKKNPTELLEMLETHSQLMKKHDLFQNLKEPDVLQLTIENAKKIEKRFIKGFKKLETPETREKFLRALF
ncbi:MAG: hypothetical protein H0W88_04840 [Parachlamydiaceae bacterium]|nr:hypothetical protein [Parachlamydiaceae bacterium]